MMPMIVFCITYKNLIISKKNVKNQNCIYKLGITKKYQKKIYKRRNTNYVWYIIYFTNDIYDIHIGKILCI